MHHEGSDGHVAFLSNQESTPLKLERSSFNEDVGDLELEDLEAGPSVHYRSNATSWSCIKTTAYQLYKNNVGLLLIAAAQSFFACMDFFAKLLTALEKPVPTLEVSYIQYS